MIIVMVDESRVHDKHEHDGFDPQRLRRGWNLKLG